jgi:hypothetical protein
VEHSSRAGLRSVHCDSLRVHGTTHPGFLLRFVDTEQSALVRSLLSVVVWINVPEEFAAEVTSSAIDSWMHRAPPTSPGIWNVPPCNSSTVHVPSLPLVSPSGSLAASSSFHLRHSTPKQVIPHPSFLNLQSALLLGVPYLTEFPFGRPLISVVWMIRLIPRLLQSHTQNREPADGVVPPQRIVEATDRLCSNGSVSDFGSFSPS